MSEGILVVVSGRSQKGKNRISEAGRVLCETDVTKGTERTVIAR